MSVTPLSVVVWATGRELGAWDRARFTWNWSERGREGGREGEGGGGREGRGREGGREGEKIYEDRTRDFIHKHTPPYTKKLSSYTDIHCMDVTFIHRSLYISQNCQKRDRG